MSCIVIRHIIVVIIVPAIYVLLHMFSLRSAKILVYIHVWHMPGDEKW